ncbi:MAG: nitroreductase/quinone reductase family protein [Solirubrobacteraceae bacterium]
MAAAHRLPYVDPYKPRGRLYFAVARLSATKFGAWFSINVAWKLDPLLMSLTKGRLSTTGPLAAALLESRGARTGQPRRNATLYFHDGERVTIIASKRGWPSNPSWYYNVCANPDILYGGRPYRAELVKDEAERRRLWALADRVFPEYADYRERAAKAGREIPIFQLAPR